VIPSSPQKKSPKKPTQKKLVPSAIATLSLDLTLTLATVSTMAKELEATAPKSSATVPPTVTGYTRAVIRTMLWLCDLASH
jgi:hypothetical protein